MAIDQATLIQAVYDAIFSAYTQSPIPGVPSGNQNREIFLTLEWPGQQLDASQYQNPWSPQNPQGQQIANEYFSALVAPIPALFPIYTDSGIKVEESYQFMLGATPVSVSDSNSFESNPVATAFANARSIFERSKLASLVNPGLNYYPAYATPANWYDEVAAKSWTKITISSKQLQTKSDSPFVKTGGLERARAGVWKLPEKVTPEVNNQLKVRPELVKQILINPDLQPLRVNAVNQQVQSLNPAVQRLTSQPLKSAQPIQMQQISPVMSQTQQLNPERLKAQRLNTELSRVQRINPELLKRIEFVAVKDYSLDQETKDLEISFRFCRVAIQRPWITSSLLKLGGWYIAGQAPGSLSTGSLENNSGLFPLIPTAFIAVRDLEIRAAWGQQDRNIAVMASSNSQPIGFGPFSLSGNYAESGKSYSSSFDGVTISSPGLQVLGWINQITPYAPPKV